MTAWHLISKSSNYRARLTSKVTQQWRNTAVSNVFAYWCSQVCLPQWYSLQAAIGRRRQLQTSDRQ